MSWAAREQRSPVSNLHVPIPVWEGMVVEGCVFLLQISSVFREYPSGLLRWWARWMIPVCHYFWQFAQFFFHHSQCGLQHQLLQDQLSNRFPRLGGLLFELLYFVLFFRLLDDH